MRVLNRGSVRVVCATVLALAAVSAPAASETIHPPPTPRIVVPARSKTARAAPHKAATRIVPGPLFSRRDGWVALGFAAATAAALPLDQLVAHNLQLPQNQNEPGLVRASAVFRDLADPGTIYVSGGMYLAGRLFGNPTLTDMGLHTSEALVFASAVGFVLKGAVGRPLPRQHNADADSYHFGRGIRVDGNWQAFPSGHTLAAFSVASAVTAEAFDRWPSHAKLIGVLTYGAATASGISRLYNNAHWVSDIIFGAGIGIFSGIKTVQYEHAHPDDWVNRVLGHASLTPGPHGGATVGFSFTTG